MPEITIEKIRARQRQRYEAADLWSSGTSSAMKDVDALLAEVDRTQSAQDACFRKLTETIAEADRLKAVLSEVAIPSLRYCEQKYDYDNQARLNCEASIDGY